MGAVDHKDKNEHSVCLHCGGSRLRPEALVVEGNTVAVIEHNMEIIKEADYIIDLMPEGGDEGGRVVAAGSPVELLAHPNGSCTAGYLMKYVNRK